MKKYLFIYKAELMSNLQYVFNIIAGFIGYFIHILIFFYLWDFIYSNPNEIINGYSREQMIWYVILTELLWSVLSGRKLCRKISEEIKGGNIAYNVNKPYDYILYSLANHLGSSTIRMIICSILGFVIGFIFLGSFPQLNIIRCILVFITVILAIIINMLLTIFIGLFSFFIEDSSPFYWIYSKLILIIGTIFPIEYFPRIIQPILKLTPIYVVSYGPARLFVNFSWNEFISIIIAQIIYVFISYTICSILYMKGVKKLNVNGG